MQQLNFTVQREVAKDMVATVGFVGSAGAKLYWARNINQPDPGPGAIDPRRPYYNLYPRRDRNHMAGKFRATRSSLRCRRPSKSASAAAFTSLATGRGRIPWTMLAATGAQMDPFLKIRANRRGDWSTSNSGRGGNRVNLAADLSAPIRPRPQICFE